MTILRRSTIFLTRKCTRNRQTAHAIPEYNFVFAAVVFDGSAIVGPINLRIRIALNDALESSHAAGNHGDVFKWLEMKLNGFD